MLFTLVPMNGHVMINFLMFIQIVHFLHLFPQLLSLYLLLYCPCKHF